MFNTLQCSYKGIKRPQLYTCCAQVVIVVKNLVLSRQGGYHDREVSLCKKAITLPNKLLVEQGTQAGYLHTY